MQLLVVPGTHRPFKGHEKQARYNIATSILTQSTIIVEIRNVNPDFFTRTQFTISSRQ